MLSRQIVILLLLAVQSIFGLICTMKYRPTCQEMNCEKGTKCVITSECGDKKCEAIEKPQEPLTQTYQQTFKPVECTREGRMKCQQRNCEMKYPGTKCVKTTYCGDTKCVPK